MENKGEKKARRAAKMDRRTLKAWRAIDKALSAVEEYNGHVDPSLRWDPPPARIDYEMGLASIHRRLKNEVEGR